MKRLRLAIIGTGRVSPCHFAAVKALPDLVELAAVCDLVPANMEQAVSNAGLTELTKAGTNTASTRPIEMFTDYRELIQITKPDIAAIATDSGSHAEIGLYCLSQGVHCIIEKPIALSISDADRLITTAKENNRILSVCHQNRFNKSIQKIREALNQDRFGKLSHIAAHVRWNRNEDYYKQAPWRGTWASDGGCLMNQCIHCADILRWFMGDIEEVTAYTRNAQHPYIEAEDLGLALVRNKEGVLGLFEGTVNVYPKNLEETLYVFGEKGTVKAAGTSLNLIEEWSFADTTGNDDSETVKAESAERPPTVYGFGHLPLYRDVIEAITTGRKPAIDGNEGKRALELILAMYKSSLIGETVKLPLDEFSTLNMT